MSDLQQKILDAKKRLDEQSKQMEDLMNQSTAELDKLKSTSFLSIEEVMAAIDAQSDSFHNAFNEIFQS